MLQRILFLGLLLPCLISCDESAELDILKPELTAEFIQNGDDADLQQTVRGILQILISAQDNDAIASIEVTVDNAVIHTETHIEAFEFDFDTRTISDGAHVLKIVVTDKAGNITESLHNFSSDNVYITLSMPAVNFEMAKYWMVLSDSEGTILDFKALQSKTSVTYPLGYSEGDDLYFTLFTRHLTSASVTVRSYKDFPQGEYTGADMSSSEWPSVGSHQVNIPEGYNSYLEVTTGSRHYATQEASTYVDLQLLQSPADLYILSTQNPDQPTYYYNSAITAGTSTTVDMEFINNMLPLTKHAVSGVTGNMVLAVVEAAVPNHPFPPFTCYTALSDAATIDLYYPKELESTLEFSSHASYGKRENGFHVTCGAYKSDGLLNSINELDGTLQTISSKDYPHIDMNFTGSADFIKLQMKAPDPSSFRWDVRVPFSNDIDFSLPQFSSAELTELGLEAMPVIQTDFVILLRDESPQIKERLIYSLVNPGYDLNEYLLLGKTYNLNQ